MVTITLVLRHGGRVVGYAESFDDFVASIPLFIRARAFTAYYVRWWADAVAVAANDNRERKAAGAP